jgi:hypothetical protein
MTAGAVFLVLSGATPLTAQAVRVDAVVRVSDHLVAGIRYAPPAHHVRPAPVVVVRPAPVVVVTRPVVFRRAPVHYYHRHGHPHRHHRHHPRGLRVVGRRDW